MFDTHAASSRPLHCAYAHSALHVLGPAGGLERQIAPEDIQERVLGAHLRGMDNAAVRCPLPFQYAPGREVLPMVEDPNDESDDPTGDVQGWVHPAPSAPGRCRCPPPLRLAPEGARPGERAWLLGAPAASRSAVAAAYSAVVQRADDIVTIIHLDAAHARLDLCAFSGAPVVRADGALIGLLSGGDWVPGSDRRRLYCNLLPASAIRRWLPSPCPLPRSGGAQ